MKKSILLSIIFVAFFQLANCQNSRIIGKCQFYYEKDAPRQSTSTNGMTIYHNGDFKAKGVNGKYTIYTCTGTVWVIFHTKKAAETSKFLGGNVQTCSNYHE